MMEESQVSIVDWARATFGKPGNYQDLALRCEEEFNELMSAVFSDDTEAALEECADVYIVLCQVAEALGHSLQEAVDSKMATNRARKWKVTGEGTGQHE